MKKIFVDIYLAFNLGDDLFLELLSKKYPNSEITVNYVGKNYDEFIKKYDNVKRRKYTIFNKVLQRLKIKDYLTNYEDIASEYDALVFIGGSIFREEYYHNSLYQDRMNIIKEFNKKDKPVFIVGSNFGPYKTKEFFNSYRELYKLCKDVCFRDLYSYNLFKDLPNVRYSPDIVFQMDTSEYLKENNKNKIGYSIIDVRHKDGLAKYYDEYVESTIKSIELFTTMGYECCLMSFCKEEGDLQVICDIKDKLSTEALKSVTVYEYKGDLKEAINCISEFKLFVAARFHANIIGLLCNVAIIPVIYSHKTSNMLEDIGLGDLLVGMDNLHLQYDKDIINTAFNNKINLDSISKESKKQFYELDKFIGNYNEMEHLKI